MLDDTMTLMNRPELLSSPNLVSLPPHQTATKNSFPVTQQLNEQVVGGNTLTTGRQGL